MCVTVIPYYSITVREYCCNTVLPHCCVAGWLYYSFIAVFLQCCITVFPITVLVYECVTVIPYYRITVRLYCCNTVIPQYCIPAWQYYCFVAVFLYCCITVFRIAVLICPCIAVILHYRITVQVYCSNTVLPLYYVAYYGWMLRTFNASFGFVTMWLNKNVPYFGPAHTHRTHS